MILFGVLIKAYTVITFSIVLDEAWNASNPRPFPAKKYNMMQWEEQDFIKMKDGSYILRPKRKVDSKLKKYARDKYYNKE
tara:strand:- start:881 stop:1120 length:240 start_codon:yes stop_codon:yes gene_type:complete